MINKDHIEDRQMEARFDEVSAYEKNVVCKATYVPSHWLKGRSILKATMMYSLIKKKIKIIIVCTRMKYAETCYGRQR